LSEYAAAQLAWDRFQRVDGYVMLLGFIVAGRA
jgi:hypothetical protein